MTTTRTPKRLTVDAIARTLRTGEEWRGIHRAATTTGFLWLAILVAGLGFGALGTVNTAQAVTVYSDVYRPVPASLRAALRQTTPEVWTIETTRARLPQGWTPGEFTRRAWECSQQEMCARELRWSAGWWWSRLPGNLPARLAEWCAGGLILLFFPMLLLQGDMRRWPDWEARTLARHERNTRRTSRGGRA